MGRPRTKRAVALCILVQTRSYAGISDQLNPCICKFRPVFPGLERQTAVLRPTPRLVYWRVLVTLTLLRSGARERWESPRGNTDPPGQKPRFMPQVCATPARQFDCEIYLKVTLRLVLGFWRQAKDVLQVPRGNMRHSGSEKETGSSVKLPGLKSFYA